MNIAEAKDCIRDTLRIYLKKDAQGKYLLPAVHQRPIFLLGPPGIGKTAVMEQVAEECKVGLLSYSMTHHTRQSALGLPYIEKKNYGGKEYAVSEYTMSEIIASIYDYMEETGHREGILFLDEINCVSETLYPSMLQFLQYKTFGRHAVPAGWVVVTAGNPPEYNRQAREFDVVTLDRLKLITVDADRSAWQAYADMKRIHPAIRAYLELKEEHFYVMELTAEGREYVTPRGWEDLSRMLRMYETEGLEAGEDLIGQYLHHETAVKEFAAYYELYLKYEKDWRINEFLHGEECPGLLERAAEAAFDEKLLLAGLITDRLETDAEPVLKETDALMARKAALSGEEEREAYRKSLAELKTAAAEAGDELKRAFAFSEQVFAGGSEELYLITRITLSGVLSRFVALFGSEEYTQLSDKLMLSERGMKLKREVLALELA
ncbi:MAG: AAA family ATPase [Lachnospiraceae bacterium]|nr:AAA family ATPase [Lachnospiraceae bacterium]